MFFNRIFGRKPADGGEQAPRAQVFDTRQADAVRLDDVMPSSSPRLAALFHQRYADAETAAGQASQTISTAMAEVFAEVDPLPIAIDLTKREPLMQMLANHRNTDATRRLSYVFDHALQTAWHKTSVRHGDKPVIGAADLDLMLRALALMIAHGLTDLHWGKGAIIRPIVAAAAARPEPAVRQAIITAFDDSFKGRVNIQSIAAVIEKLLPLTDIDPGEIPAMAEIARRSVQLDGIRQQVLEAAGELLAPALEAVLNGTLPSLSLRDLEKREPLAALTGLSPGERGVALHHMLELLSNPGRFGIAKWGELERRNGRYMIGMHPSEYLRGMGTILGTFATRKIELCDPDEDIAGLLRLVPQVAGLSSKRVLDLVLETVVAHPHGKAHHELQALRQRQVVPALVSDNAIRIEDVLRNLPQPATPAGGGDISFGGAAMATPSRLFGKRGLAPQAPPEGNPSLLRGLAPIALPEWDLTTWNTTRLIATHFDNLFEARLYDQPHLEFLARLAALDERIKAHTAGAQNFVRMFEAAAAQLGFSRAHWQNARGRDSSIRATTELGADLHARFTAFTPIVLRDPERLRRLAGLASEVAEKSAPTKKWLQIGREAIADLTPAERIGMIDALISIPSPATMNTANESHLRTVLYLSADLEPQVLGPKLVNYALKQCYVTLPGIGMRSEKLGNACVWTLAAMPAGSGVPYLARILARTKYPKIKAKIDAALNQAASQAGMSRTELDELTVPTHDLDAQGCRSVAFAAGRAVVRVTGNAAAIEWFNEQDKLLKAPSAAMKAEKALLNQLRADVKELDADLAIQPQRLQRLYLEARSWPADVWQSRYLDHPLLRALALRLIWWIDAADGSSIAALPDATGESLCDVAGRPVLLDGATIRLWHPIEGTVAEVEAWRDRLEALQVTQPFAQAWREVYALTDAERATGTYSNRWAAHILRQHQAMTLARLNGWRVTHRMWVDARNDEPWHLTIPAHGLVVDYWVQGAGGENPEVTDSAAYAYVATDRVQFHAVLDDARDSARGPTRGRAVPLEEIPPVVFSEVMRQADLFTAVASIAADPNWLDRGNDAQHPNQWARDAAAYWSRTNTADLEESGKRRRAMLQRIVPRLKIADKLGFEDRYLTVEGKRHRYRVHLGSGACFRGERHICIVPKNEFQAGRIWLPFEGDRTLSIILSKAVLLADDDKITDPVILRQL